MFGMGLLLGIGLGCNSCRRSNCQYDRRERCNCRQRDCYDYNQCNYGYNRCGCGCGSRSQYCNFRDRY